MQFWQHCCTCCRPSMPTRYTRQACILSMPLPVCCRLFLLSLSESLPGIVGAMQEDLALVTACLFYSIFHWHCSVRLRSLSTLSSDWCNRLAHARFINSLRPL